MKTIGILGVSGSIGRSALEVLSQYPEEFTLTFVSVHTNVSVLEEILPRFGVKHVLVTSRASFDALEGKYPEITLHPPESLVEFLHKHPADITLNAIVGTAGLIPSMTLASLGRDIALANKESLVCAGELMMEACRKSGSRLFPVDSEHSAIWQCLQGKENPVEKLILTASGGAFRDKSRSEIQHLPAALALKHPNWDMGAKITIDSATLINKGLEIMEAHWLFDIAQEKIEVLVHRQSIVHSMVQFTDGAILAQLGTPDMRLPISYALTYPDRFENDWERVDLLRAGILDFAPVDTERFPGLALCRKALEEGGDRPMVLNCVNEVMVQRYLRGEASFYEITDMIERAFEEIPTISSPTLEQLLERGEYVRHYLEEYFA